MSQISNSDLSAQAKAILLQVVRSNTFTINTNKQQSLENGRKLKLDEPQFLEEDLYSLCKIGYLSPSLIQPNPTVFFVYYITRLGTLQVNTGVFDDLVTDTFGNVTLKH